MAGDCLINLGILWHVSTSVYSWDNKFEMYELCLTYKHITNYSCSTFHSLDNLYFYSYIPLYKIFLQYIMWMCIFLTVQSKTEQHVSCSKSNTDFNFVLIVGMRAMQTWSLYPHSLTWEFKTWSHLFFQCCLPRPQHIQVQLCGDMLHPLHAVLYEVSWKKKPASQGLSTSKCHWKPR